MMVFNALIKWLKDKRKKKAVKRVISAFKIMELLNQTKPELLRSFGKITTGFVKKSVYCTELLLL